ncbi:MAG: dTMP kinase [Burkholderiaceae bacterium]
MTQTDDSRAAPARFITFEGIDGAGKSSVIEWFAERLREQGLGVVSTREPGGVPFAETLRQMLLHEAIRPETETLLAFAARAEHLAQKIEPALAAGQWVLCDRFTDSTFAYQGAGRGVDWTMLESLERFVHPHRQPDRSYLFDLAPEEAARRRAAVRAADRFEAQDVAFFGRVRDGYLRRQRAAPERIRLIDAGADPETVRRQLAVDLQSLGIR